MRIYRSVLAAMGGLCLLGAGTSASAGSHCDYEAVPMRGQHNGPAYDAVSAPADCAPGVVVHSQPVVVDPMHVNINHPFGHLKSVNYSATPTVNVTRLYGQSPMVGLQDAPTQFSDGCHPSSSVYCRDAGAHNMVRPVAVEMAAPAPVYAAPVYTAPAQVAVDTSYQSRTYGSLDFVPGIAHVPTSYVDRSESNRDAVLASGRAVPQTVHHATGSYNSVSTQTQYSPQYSPMTGSMSVMTPPPTMAAPVMVAPVMAGQGVPYTAPAADGTYWEKVSGMTAFGDTIATQVVCKKAMPVEMVRPVIGVPHPVPTPVMSNCVQTVEHNSRYGEGFHGGHVEHARPHHVRPHQQAHHARRDMRQAPMNNSRYGAAPVGWTY